MSYTHWFTVGADTISKDDTFTSEELAELEKIGVDFKFDLEIEVEASISGGYSAATHWDPAEYPEVEITGVSIEDTKVSDALGHKLISLAGGSGDLEESIMDSAESYAEESAAEAMMDCYEDDICGQYYDPY